MAAVTIAGVNVATALNGKQATITSSTALSAASLTTSGYSTMNGLRIAAGQGRDGVGASLRVVGSGTDNGVHNTSSVYWGQGGVDLNVWELSWLTMGHYWRPIASTAYAQTMGISLTTGAWTSYKGLSAASDRSLKDDIVDANSEQCLSMLRQVSAKTYTRKDLNDGPRLGFVAQDVEAACPPLWSNLVSTAAYKWEQSPPEGAEIKVLDYARLTSVLWQCTRSLLARVEALEARVQ